MSKITDNAVTRAEEARKNELEAYKKAVANLQNVFSTPEGAEALKYMRHLAGVERPVFGEQLGYDPIKAAFADGARAFVIDLCQMINLPK